MTITYLRDNGKLTGWPTMQEEGCKLVQWTDDLDFSVLDAQGKPLGWGEDAEEAMRAAVHFLTNRQRKLDGVVPAKVCGPRAKE